MFSETPTNMISAKTNELGLSTQLLNAPLAQLFML